MELIGKPQNQIYEDNPNSFILNQHPILVVTPAIHIVTRHISTTVPYVLINLATVYIFVDKNEILRFLSKIDVEICEILQVQPLKF